MTKVGRDVRFVSKADIQAAFPSLFAFGLLIPFETQCPQPVHVCNGCFATRVFLLECIVDFRIASLAALKNGFSKSALVRVSHMAPSTVTRCPTRSGWRDRTECAKILNVSYLPPSLREWRSGASCEGACCCQTASRI